MHINYIYSGAHDIWLESATTMCTSLYYTLGSVAPRYVLCVSVCVCGAVQTCEVACVYILCSPLRTFAHTETNASSTTSASTDDIATGQKKTNPGQPCIATVHSRRSFSPRCRWPRGLECSSSHTHMRKLLLCIDCVMLVNGQFGG